MSDVTQLLKKAQNGDRQALDELLPIVYHELRQVASGALAMERPNHTLQATEIVHEAYLKLVNQHSVDWNSRIQFFSIAAETIRRILINHAKKRNRQKRGEGKTLLQLDEAISFSSKPDIDLIDLDDALIRLSEMDEQQAKIVELRFFGGLKNEEIAEILKISDSTVKREWRTAKAWLLTELKN
ncbi:MAG: sigma-70 family RNA polymerase sigma factor [Pyrinomonadaceae bacterium]|nr:sigma-70 family RNA polymerase sigma factor [Pyrinomonadaceae bacterium]